MPLRAKHRSRFLIVFLLLSAALVLGACRRGGDDGDDEAPTIARLPSITPGGTSTLTTQSPTPFPSPGAIAASPTRFAGFPSSGGVATIPSNLPNNIQITSPVFGQQLQGFVSIFGSASHPDFIQYAVEFGPDPNPGGLFYPITPQAVTVPVFNSALGGWNTGAVPDGQYQIRLHVWLRGGREVTNVVVSGLQVRNRLPTNTPPRTNNNPVISPIAPLTLRTGIAATIALGIYDPDNDATSFYATTDNVNVATVSPVGQAITVQAKSAGIATVTVRVTDVRGGTAQTSFLITVQQQATTNNPPSIAPIPSQIMTQGTVITVPISLSDPDGDPVTFTVTSALPSILSATAGTGQSLVLSALNSGTTSVSVTASDGKGGTFTSVFAVVINPKAATNNPPSIAAVPSQSINVGENRDLTLSIQDPDAGDTLTTTVTSNNTAVTVTKNSNTSIRITGVSAGSAQITVSVSDGKGGSASTVFGVTVNAPPPQNRPPVIAAIGAQTVKVGETITVNLNISDPDGDTLTYSATSSDPAAASAAAGENNTVRVTGVAVGKANVTVAVGDGRGGSTSTTFAVQVDPAVVQNNPPTIATIGDISVTAGQSQTVDFVASDPDGDALNINVASDNAGVATALRAGETTINVTGVAGGTANVTVSVDDGKGGTANETFAVTVTAANQSPVIDAVGQQNCLPGGSVNVDLNVSDADGDTVTIASTSDNTGVATVNASGEPLAINCVAQGTATINVSGSDGKGGTANISFGVTVGAPPNQNPTLNGIGGQTCTVGDTVTVTLTYNDPEGNAISVSSSSDNASAAAVNATGEPLVVTCTGAGTANITVNLDDGNGGTASTSFVVTVNAPANQNPTLNAVNDQTCTVGDTLNITLSYSDPEGNPISVTSSSDNPGAASVNASGEPLSVFCASAGFATITVNISDGNGGTASVSFAVTVNAPANQNPTINPISGQTCTVGDTVTVTLTYNDPEGNPISVTSSSDNPGAASVNASGEPLSVFCASAGSANITVNLDDGNGGTVSTPFAVSVNPPANQNPTLDPIGGQTCNEGDTLTITPTYNDPDGNPISVSAFSDNPGVADVNASGEPLNVTCSTAGSANITVGIDDGNGGTASTSFGVTVNAVAPPFDVTQYPELPDIGALQPGIGGVYNNGQSQGKRNDVFSVAGDESVNSSNFLNNIAANPVSNSDPDLQAIVNFYNVPAHTVGDTSSNSFDVQSAASGNGWTIDRLFDPNSADTNICNPGETPLACELRIASPAVLFISFTPSNATQTGQDQFNNLLQQAVDTALANGTIPVLAALPNDGFVDAGIIADYNEIIVTVADNNDVPLWNVYVTMEGSSGVYSVSGSDANDFNDLSGGANRRNLAALQVLIRIRQALFP
ncbi:MAG: hypothetical protein BroJett018_07480 [Chloroflexota bacterium]|nr:hypothetical protein [Chloroflexota bacterium]NOG63142.1 hypothetical protein [Chloroflexota bacterium]GIK62954.1 MAG: hypothetical protein BroJett018_07480 [Chloroflexota bacterium]